MLTSVSVELAVAWRHQIHQNPELGFCEDDTASLVADVCADLGLEVTRGIGGTGVVATWPGTGGGRSIGLRADMDALPITEQGTPAYCSTNLGVFHGCGHDGHTAILLGAAAALVEAGPFAGDVHLIFQPCEETGHGAQAMIDDGLFDRFEMAEIYGLHNMPGLATGDFALRVGPMMSFEDNFEIRIAGRGGHASMPDRSIDAIVVGAEIVTALGSIVARSISPIDAAVVSVTEFETDGARNVIASNVVLRGDCRGFSDTVSTHIEERLRAIVAGVCQAHGATSAVDYTREFFVLNNTADEVAHAAAAAETVVGAARVNAEAPRTPASEDFARMLAVKPGCYVLVGNGTDGPIHGGSLHNPFYDFNDQLVGIGIAYWVALVAARMKE